MRITGDGFHVKIAGAIDKAIDEFRDEMVANAEDAVQVMRDQIDAASTPTGLSRGQTGRIDSGKMRDSAKYWVPDKRKYFMQYVIGWKEEDFADERTPNYVIIQDEGFVHVPDGSFIPGVHALQDAREEFIRTTTVSLNKHFI